MQRPRAKKKQIRAELAKKEFGTLAKFDQIGGGCLDELVGPCPLLED